MAKRFGVGIVGVQPGRSWAATAHIPALRALSDDYEIAGIANTSLASAEKAAAAFDIPRAFESVEALVASPDVDIVAVTVKVPHHHELAARAIAAGKTVYCEWPLGNGLAEARDLAARAEDKGVLAVAGTQARCAPAIEHLRALVADGYVGEPLSVSIIGSGGVWGAGIDLASAYALDRSNGATMLTIPFGHIMAAVRDVLGDVVELSATLANRRTTATVAETGAELPMTSHDQLIVAGRLASGAPIAVHYRGGLTRGTGLLWEINGTEGDLRVTGAFGHAQMIDLALTGGRGDDMGLKPIAIPKADHDDLPAAPRNVARFYARLGQDLRHGTRTTPTFADAVALHQLIAAIEASAESGERVAPGGF